MWLLLLILLIIGPGEAFLDGGMAGVADWFISTFTMLPGIVVGLSFHEFAHAKVADLCGDPTPRAQGRVTIDPRAHIDPLGLFSLIFIHFGWGRPVMIVPSNFDHGKRDRIFVGLAGVTMNLFLAFLFGGIIKLIATVGESFFFTDFGSIVGQVLIEVIIVNISLMLFNLLPVPPLDGFGVLSDVFNLYGTSFYYFVMKNSMMILMLLIIFHVPSMLLSTLLWRVANFIMATVYGLPGWYILL